MSKREVWVVEGYSEKVWIAGVSAAKGDALSYQREMYGRYGGVVRYRLVRYVPAPIKRKAKR